MGSTEEEARAELRRVRGDLERLGAELEAARAERQRLEAANEAKSQFLAAMSYELRTPMNAILGMTELALEEELSPKVRDMLQTARDSADSLLELLDEILDLSRIEAGRLQLEERELHLRDVVSRCLKPLLLRASQKGLLLTWEVLGEVPDRLRGDPTRLRLVLTNLVSNAIKFTQQGRVAVVVALTPAPLPGADEGGERADQVSLEVSVSDTGIGISPEDQKRIFAPFTQADASTSRRFGGSGPGLTISQRLVELMGGRLRVESRPGEGSTFSFTARLGVVAEPRVEAGAGPARAAAQAPPRRPLRVLLAEDTPASQKLALMVLERRGHVVEVAANGLQALGLLSRRDYDVVVMDVQMPEMDGFQATAAIRAFDDPRKSQVPIIALTAHALKDDEDRCLAAGMDAYVSKPIEAQALIRVVEEAGGPGLREPPVETAPLTPEPPFDLDVAVKRCFGQESMFREMVGCFFDESQEVLERLRAALERRDAAELAAAAHRLKGTVVYLGAQLTVEATQRLVDIGRSGDLAPAAEALEALTREVGRLALALEPYRSSTIG